jgi:hypothetical protein
MYSTTTLRGEHAVWLYLYRYLYLYLYGEGVYGSLQMTIRTSHRLVPFFANGVESNTVTMLFARR